MILVLLISKTCAEVVNIVKVICNLSIGLDSNDWSTTFPFYRLPAVILLPKRECSFSLVLPVKTLGTFS